MVDQNTARAFWIQKPGEGVVRSEPLPELRTGEVRVRALYSGISRGTEALVFRGEVPPTQHGAMRCPFQAGEFPAPVKYGYASVGVVDEGVGETARALVGREIFCLHPHQDRYVVPADAVAPLPEGLPASRAVLAANMETALNAVWDGGAGPGDTIVVVGGGVVGMLVAWLAGGIPGTSVTVVDPNPRRRPVADTLGVAYAPSVQGGAPADVVFHASGQPQGLAAALDAVGMDAVVVELSWFGTTPVTLPLGEGFHARRTTIRSSQVGRLPTHRTPRWDHARRMRTALELLRDPALDALVTGESSFQELPGLMERLAREPGDELCHRIHYP